MKQTDQFRFAKRANERCASTSAAGVRSDVSGLARDWEGDYPRSDVLRPPRRLRLYRGPSWLDPGGKAPRRWPNLTGAYCVATFVRGKAEAAGEGIRMESPIGSQGMGAAAGSWHVESPGGPELPGPGGRSCGRCRPRGARGGVLGDGPEPMGLIVVLAAPSEADRMRRRGRGRIDLARGSSSRAGILRLVRGPRSGGGSGQVGLVEILASFILELSGSRMAGSQPAPFDAVVGRPRDWPDSSGSSRL